MSSNHGVSCILSLLPEQYLSLLARTGRLEAMKRGRNWYTTATAIGRYRDSLTY